MEILVLLRPRRTGSRGFTLVEVLVSMVVLVVGLVTLSSLAAKTLFGTQRSQFSGVAANLASEKLEDLNRWPSWDPNVYAAPGTTVGSLTADTSASVTSNGITETVAYFDDVENSNANGAVSETVSQQISGVTTFVTTSHNADGTTVVTSNPTAATADVNVTAFHRRWIVEKDQPIMGVRRITVVVTLTNSYINPPVSFQTSMVRP
jgi:prepilin-type N-terminal cleavage/methylation domain-containing protein